MYKAVYADDNFEIIQANNDIEAIQEAERYEAEHGDLFNIWEINNDYEEIRMIF